MVAGRPIDAPDWHTDHLVSSFYPRDVQLRSLAVESRFGDDVIGELRERGHDVTVTPDWSLWAPEEWTSPAWALTEAELADEAHPHGPYEPCTANWPPPGTVMPLPGTMPAPPHDATGHTWHHNDESLFTTVKYGGQANSPPGYVNRMPPFGSILNDGEIFAVLAYIKSTWPLEIQQAQQSGHE